MRRHGHGINVSPRTPPRHSTGYRLEQPASASRVQPGADHPTRPGVLRRRKPAAVIMCRRRRRRRRRRVWYPTSSCRSIRSNLFRAARCILAPFFGGHQSVPQAAHIPESHVALWWMTFPSVSQGEAAADARRDYTPVQEHVTPPTLSLSGGTLSGELLGSVKWDSSADVTFRERERERHTHTHTHTHLALYHRRHPFREGEINGIRVARPSASMFKEGDKGEDTGWFRVKPTWIKSSLVYCRHTHTHTHTHTMLLWSVVIYLRWLKPPDQDGGYTVQPNSVVYNVICTFKLILG